MATATVPITKCAPGAARNAVLDEHVRLKSAWRVAKSVSFRGGDEWEAPGLIHADLLGSQTTERVNNSFRESSPSWTLNDKPLRAVLVRYVESRAGFVKPNIGSEVERMQRAQAKLQQLRPEKEAVLTRLARIYVRMKNSGADKSALQQHAIQIENLDTQLLITEKIAAKALMIVNLYYRVGMNSVEVGQEVNLKPPHIRIILFRLRTIAWKLGLGEKPRFGTTGGGVKGCKGARTPKPFPKCNACGKPCPTCRSKYCVDCLQNYNRIYYQRTKGLPDTSSFTKDRLAIISSPEFGALFEAARLRMNYPDQPHCKNGHAICVANAHVGDLRRTGRYQCDPCWREAQERYKARMAAARAAAHS